MSWLLQRSIDLTRRGEDAGDGSFVLPRRIMDEPMKKEGEYIQTMNNRGRGSGLMLIIVLLVALLITCKRQGTVLCLGIGRLLW